MNDNTLGLLLIIWICLMFTFTSGDPDLLDHIVGAPIECSTDD